MNNLAYKLTYETLLSSAARLSSIDLVEFRKRIAEAENFKPTLDPDMAIASRRLMLVDDIAKLAMDINLKFDQLVRLQEDEPKKGKIIISPLASSKLILPLPNNNIPIKKKR